MKATKAMKALKPMKAKTKQPTNSKYAKNEACRSIASLTGTAPKDVKEALENALKEKKNKAEIVVAYSEAAKLMGLTQNEVKEAVQGLVNSRQCCACNCGPCCLHRVLIQEQQKTLNKHGTALTELRSCLLSAGVAGFSRPNEISTETVGAA